MKYILTGSSGFVGVNLSSFILKEQLGEIVKLDLRQQLPDTLPSANAVIHLAGKAHDLKNVSDASEYFRVNTELTKQLFDLFLQGDISDFIYFSSVKAVADTVQGILLEDIAAKPGTPYGQSKHKAEEYMLSKTLPKYKRLFIFRPCMIHGPGNKGNLNLLYKAVKKGIPYPLGAFENRRSFLSISNLLFIMKSILTDNSINGGIYNLADDEAIATADVIKVMGDAIGKKSHVWKLPTVLLRNIAKMGDLFRLPLNSERLKKLTESYVVDNTKIKRVLNVKELPTSVKEGLFNTIKSFED